LGVLQPLSGGSAPQPFQQSVAPPPPSLPVPPPASTDSGAPIDGPADPAPASGLDVEGLLRAFQTADDAESAPAVPEAPLEDAESLPADASTPNRDGVLVTESGGFIAIDRPRAASEEAVEPEATRTAAATPDSPERAA